MNGTPSNERMTAVRDANKERIVSMCGDWTQLKEIEAQTGLSYQTTKYMLIDLVTENRLIETMGKVGRKGLRRLYKRAPESHINPLYETTLDAGALASCWGGYTFKTGAHPCHQ